MEVRVGTLKPAYKTERKKADICACRRLHGSEVDSSCSSMVQIARVGLIVKEQYANSFGKVKKALVRITLKVEIKADFECCQCMWLSGWLSE